MRIVIKIGTSTIAHKTGMLNIRYVEHLVKVISDLKNAGNEIAIVSSGAIGMGVGKLMLGKRPEDMPTKQAAAAVGQCELMYTYDRLFGEYNHTVAQVLLTADDLQIEKRRLNFKNTIFRLFELNALPIINENDAVSTAEIGVTNTIGENDTLAAIVAEFIGAELLILLSDIEGFYDCDPKSNPNAKLISLIEEITPEIETAAGGKGSEFGTGGMATKIKAAKIVTESGGDMIIMNGNSPDRLYDAVSGKTVGTKFKGRRV